MTACKKIGEHVPDGCSHVCPIYQMVPGTAWRLTVGSAERVEVTIDAALAERATYTYLHKQFSEQPAVLFEVDGVRYAQLYPGFLERRPKKTASRDAPKRGAMALVPEELPERVVASSEPVTRAVRTRKCGPRSGLVIL